MHDQQELWAAGSETTAPKLVVHGSDDVVNPAADGPLLAERIPGAERHLVAGARHVCYEECQDEVARVVIEFLRRTSGDSAAGPRS